MRCRSTVGSSSKEEEVVEEPVPAEGSGDETAEGEEGEATEGEETQDEEEDAEVAEEIAADEEEEALPEVVTPEITRVLSDSAAGYFAAAVAADENLIPAHYWQGWVALENGDAAAGSGLLRGRSLQESRARRLRNRRLPELVEAGPPRRGGYAHPTSHRRA